MTSRFKPMAAALAVLLAAGLAGGRAEAARKMYSYDAASDLTRAFVYDGLTIIFEKGLTGQRVERVLSTGTQGEAALKPASGGDLGKGGLAAVLEPGAEERDLYLVTDAKDGPAFIRAACRVKTKGWLAFGRLRAGEPLRIHAIGLDPATGQARRCATWEFTFHGEWPLEALGNLNRAPTPPPNSIRAPN